MNNIDDWFKTFLKDEIVCPIVFIILVILGNSKVIAGIYSAMNVKNLFFMSGK
jgi:hypothetical protein